MAILDELTTFCEALDVAASAGRANAGSSIPLGTARDIGDGEVNYLVITVTTAFASAGAATVAFALVSDSTAVPATDGSASQHLLTEAYAYTGLTAGAVLQFPIPPGNDIDDYEEYLGLQVVTAAATTTAGSISAEVRRGPATRKKTYDDATN